MDAAVEPRPRRRPRDRLRRDARPARRRPSLHPRRGPARRTTSRSSARRHGSQRCQGAELVGRRYTPLFAFFADTAERVPGARRRLRLDRRRHRRRPHGARLRRGRPERLQRRRHPDDLSRWTSHGRFTAEIPPWVGLHVFDANPQVIRSSRRGAWCVRHDDLRPPVSALLALRQAARLPGDLLLVRRRSRAFRERMVELNQQITWVPEHVKDGSFGKWLGNARDWSISRNRFWGSPIPVWSSDDPRLSTDRRLRLARRARSATSVSVPTTSTARRSTNWSAPTPTTRPASR